MAGIDNDVLYGANVDFTGSSLVSAQVTANGQLLIGSTAAPNIRVGNLTSLDSSVTITNGAGTIDLSVVSTVFPWTTATTNTALLVNNGYVADSLSLINFTLPATSAVGQVIYIAGIGSGGWKILQNAGQNIFIGSASSTVGVSGSVASSNLQDTIFLVCIKDDTIWTYMGGAGNYTIV